MGKFEPRRYFIGCKPGYEHVTFAPVLRLAEGYTQCPWLEEVGFRRWFERMWQHSDFTEPPYDIPTERDYWEHWE